jgi:adenine phosphoribosyltransferase
MEDVKALIRDIPDFPKPGIVFKDITPVLSNGHVFKELIDRLKDRYQNKSIDVVLGIEARGFIFGASLAYALGAGFGIVRKPGKLPYKTFKESYELEYGTDTIEIHQDALLEGQKIILIDDVLATGGTASAAIKLIKNNFQASIVEAVFLLELCFLNGKKKLSDVDVFSLIEY